MLTHIRENDGLIILAVVLIIVGIAMFRTKGK